VGALVITPTFDSSITDDPNAGAIEAMIYNAINVFESQFNDPITVTILFRYATTFPDGLPLGSAIGGTLVGLYSIPWSTYIGALVKDATTASDATANARLPESPFDTAVYASSANGRAVGLGTSPYSFVDGVPYDGTVTINSGQPVTFVRPPTSGTFDAQTVTEHEIDEILGLGSYLNENFGSLPRHLQPQDLFSWSAPGVRNVLPSGMRYFSIDGGNTDLVEFNQDPNGDFGDWASASCTQGTPLVQVSFQCPDQVADVTGTSPEGINLDVIGYDLISTTTTTTTTSSTTTTTLPCTSARCRVYVAVMSPACSTGPLPRSVTRPLMRGASLADQAATSPGKRARKLRGRATKVLRRAETAATRAAKGKKPKIAADCAATLKAAAAQVVGSLGE
jgi:hypothetical protein